jgi:type I restriction enzyme S subunit
MTTSDELTFLIENLRDVAYQPGGVDHLRRTILEAALQGVLTRRDGDGETAVELLERIADAKRVYSGPGKSAKATRKSSRGSWTALEELPTGWVWTTIGEVATKIGSGSTPRGGRDSYVATGPMFLRSQNIWNDGVRLEGVARIPVETHERMSGTHVMPNDVLLNITGASIGRAALVPADIGECNVSQHVMIIRPAISEIAAFLHLYVISPRFQRMIDDVQVGISRDGLSKNSVMGMPVPLPPIGEQRRVVDKVSSALKFVARLERQISEEEAQRSQLVTTAFRDLGNRVDDTVLDLLNEVVRTPSDVDSFEGSVIELAVRGALTRSDPKDEDVRELIASVSSDALDAPQLVDKNGHTVSEPFELKEGWQWVVLGSLLSDVQGGWSPAAQGRPKEGNEWGVLKVSACSWGEFRPAENKALEPDQVPRSHLEVKPGDFIISRANTSELVGRSVIVEKTPPRLMLSDKTLRLSIVDGCNARYLNLANLASAAREHYEREATGTSKSMKNVSQRVIRRTPIPLPPRAEQDRIVATVDKLMVLLRRLRLELTA